MLKRLIEKLANPLLFYIDKSGNTVFRNFCLLKNDGMKYSEIIQIKEAGKILEYRIDLEHKLKILSVIFAIFLYMLIIHTKCSLFTIMLAVIMWLISNCIARIICTNKYTKILYENYGEFETIDFGPKINPERAKVYFTNFKSTVIIWTVILFLVISPAFLLLKGIEVLANKKSPNNTLINIMTEAYTIFYPKTPLIYDISAVSKYKSGDFIGAANDYIKIFKITGSHFCDKDLRRFANLLFLIKKVRGTQDAIDTFNEYATTKKMTPLQELKMLWIKSIFSISSQTSDFVIADYEDLLFSLDKNDEKTEFYVLADKAYMHYLLKEFSEAIEIYNNLIPKAENNQKLFGNELKSLYLERGFAKLEFGDKEGANKDFVASKVDINQIGIYEPVIRQTEFITGDF